jgi:hypothetical protein
VRAKETNKGQENILFAKQYDTFVLTEAHNEELFITSSLYCDIYFGDAAYHIPDTHVAYEEYWIWCFRSASDSMSRIWSCPLQWHDPKTKHVECALKW